MQLNTASSAVSFARTLEDDSAALYEEIARTYPEAGEPFSGFVRENKRHKTIVDRAYYWVISDALESGFSFEGLDTDDFPVEKRLAGNTTYEDALKTAITTEESILGFYRAASEASSSLMADVPRAFDRIVRKRDGRLETLRAILGGVE